MSAKKLFYFIMIIFFMPIFQQNIFAQYKAVLYENFEKGALADTLILRDESTAKNTQVVDLNSKEAAANLLWGRAKNECGKYALKMSLVKKAEGAAILGMVNKTQFNRKELGQKGRSLYQVDFYLPEDKKDIPCTMAVLASAPVEPGSTLLQIYRVGIGNGTQIFFSYTNEKIQTGGPILFKNEPLSNLKILPGWHRVQIVFEGQDKIYCAIDGKFTSFSPITEATLTNLQAGLMVTSSSKYSKSTEPVEICYADNLSIQMSPEDVPLPDSPWLNEVGDRPAPIPAKSNQQPKISANQNVTQKTAQSIAAANQVGWLISPDEAWDRCQKNNRPILTMFYAPRVPAYKKLEGILASDKTAQELLSKFILLSVEVNQLQSWAICEKYQVFKVPCFMVIGTDGKMLQKTIFTNNSAWNDTAQQIQNFVK